MKRCGKDQDKTSPVRIEARQRRQEALKLRLSGMVMREIGEVLGVSEPRAHQLVSEELNRLREENTELAEQILRLELERLDTLQQGIWNQAIGGHLGSIDHVLQIMARRARLVGIESIATRLEISGSIKNEHLIDIADLGLDLETKQMILQALRDKQAEKLLE